MTIIRVAWYLGGFIFWSIWDRFTGGYVGYYDWSGCPVEEYMAQIEMYYRAHRLNKIRDLYDLHARGKP